MITAYYIYLAVMTLLAIVVFIALQFVDAGYGMLRNSKWGVCVNNKPAWFIMEFPVFCSMIILWACSSNHHTFVPLIFLIIFELHYFQRVFVFPFLLKGNGKMPISIMFMGIVFNILNSSMQGWWLFYRAFDVNPDAYQPNWLWSPQFIIGTCMFIAGYIINLRSDNIIRNLRKDPNDNKHYLPKGGLFNKVTCANYFGEIIEWSGFAILTWSMAGLVFLIWTMANLLPRAGAIYKKYQSEFGKEMEGKNIKRIIPYIY